MRAVSNAFKSAVTAYGRQTKVIVTVGDNTFTGSSVVSVKHGFDGGLLRSVMKYCDIELDSADSVSGIQKGTEIENVSIGVKKSSDSSFSMCDLGKFVVNDISLDKANNSVVLKCYDDMLYSMVPYDLPIRYPVTVGNYLIAICDRLGWSWNFTTFINSEVEIEEEKFDSTYTYRDVLDQIAQVAAGTIAFENGSLSVLYPVSSGEIYSADNMVSSDGITIGEYYGPIDSVVLARTPQEDNIYRIADGVAFEEAVEFKIENNQIMDSHREDFIDGIFDALSGLGFYLYEFHSFGYLYVDLLDFFTLKDQNGNTYKCLMLSDEFTISQGIDETSSCNRPGETDTDYAAASKSDRTLNKAILRVDKQELNISSIVSRIDVLSSDSETTKNSLTEIKQTTDNVSIIVSNITDNGVDKVKTSIGYTFDDDGMKVAREGDQISSKVDNTGLYVMDGETTVLSANNEGVNAVNIKVNQYLVVGQHSRFEDFINENGEERTGCFWL